MQLSAAVKRLESRTSAIIGYCLKLPRRTEVPGTSFSALSSRWEGCEPYILRVCSWHFPPDGRDSRPCIQCACSSTRLSQQYKKLESKRVRPYIQCVCSWHPPDGNPRSTAVRFRRGVHGVSKNAALLSGLSSVTPQGCVVGCYPAVCSVQDYCIRPEKMGAPRKDLADAILSYNGNDSQKNGEPFFKLLSAIASSPRRRAVAPVNTYSALSNRSGEHQDRH